MQAERFHLSFQTRILTPDVAGLDTLLQALAKGYSIYATPDSTPISHRAEPSQRLYCKSSGSTGFAKTICRTPASWIASFEQDRALFDLTAKDTVGSLGDLSHSLTLYAAVTAFHVGCDLAMLGRHSPRQQWRDLNDHAVSVLYATPAQLRLLMRAGEQGGLDGLRLIFSSGGKLDPDLAARLRLALPQTRLVEIFGATETSYMTISDANTPAASVGRAYPGVELRLNELDAQGVGEIWARSPFLFEGYAQGDSAETRWHDGWLTIGEMGSIDGRGYLYLKGRRNRMVTVADVNVFPEEVEAVLLRASGASLAVALAVPDALRGNRIVAVIEGQGDAQALRRACRVQIGDHAVPKEVIFVEQIPMLPAGKPDLRALRQWYEARP